MADSDKTPAPETLDQSGNPLGIDDADLEHHREYIRQRRREAQGQLWDAEAVLEGWNADLVDEAQSGAIREERRQGQLVAQQQIANLQRKLDYWTLRLSQLPRAKEGSKSPGVGQVASLASHRR